MESSKPNKSIIEFATENNCSLEIAQICMAESDYNFDIALTIFQNL